ncbi:hypothetical protein [Rhizobium sullae]|uniref:hypothetical protein n=1 Tax=Rhizobium sullae TaxID=50338 RepID=UPI001404702B|nr:hypothetical protein [Rhizobium sullae]
MFEHSERITIRVYDFDNVLVQAANNLDPSSDHGRLAGAEDRHWLALRSVVLR